MPALQRFDFTFLDAPCRLDIESTHAEGAEIFRRYLSMFPAFAGDPARSPVYTVRVRDVGEVEPSVSADNPVFGALRDSLGQHYPGLAAALLDRICSPAFVPDAAALATFRAALDSPSRRGISLQADFLVCSDREGGLVEAFADVGKSLREAWGFHVLNFFKIFFFAAGAVRLHSSGATYGDRCLLLLANTGGGKSTMKNLFLEAVHGPVPFTDDSVMAVPDRDGFRLYQDPVEFLKWCYMPATELPQHVIPQPRSAIRMAPSIYYLSQGDSTLWRTCTSGEILDRIKEEAFYQRGFLTQRFIPPPNASELLHGYFENTAELLRRCRCHLLEVCHHGDYGPLFEQFRADLNIAGPR